MASRKSKNKKAAEWAFFRLRELGLYEQGMGIPQMIEVLKTHYNIKKGTCLRVVVGKITGDYYETRRIERERGKAKKNKEERIDTRRGMYKLYLLTPRWKQLSALALDRDKVCQQCGKQTTTRHVYHIKYPEELGNEPIEWLVVLCADCHAEIHRNSTSYRTITTKDIKN